MDVTSPILDGYRADLGGVSRYFAVGSHVRRQPSAHGDLLVITGKGFSGAFPMNANPKLYRLKDGGLSSLPLMRSTRVVNRNNCIDPSDPLCPGQPGCLASSPTCDLCPDCEGNPGAGPQANPDGTSICIVGPCGIDDSGNAFGVATFRDPFNDVSCNADLSSFEMNCEFNDTNSGGDGNVDLFRSYHWIDYYKSHELNCNPYGHYALVWTTFKDPAASSTRLSLVPGGAQGVWAHTSAFITGTSMRSQYKSGIPLREVAHCNGTD
jgi:hypothetical protein